MGFLGRASGLMMLKRFTKFRRNIATKRFPERTLAPKQLQFLKISESAHVLSETVRMCVILFSFFVSFFYYYFALVDVFFYYFEICKWLDLLVFSDKDYKP